MTQITSLDSSGQKYVILGNHVRSNRISQTHLGFSSDSDDGDRRKKNKKKPSAKGKSASSSSNKGRSKAGSSAALAKSKSTKGSGGPSSKKAADKSKGRKDDPALKDKLKEYLKEAKERKKGGK